VLVSAEPLLSRVHYGWDEFLRLSTDKIEAELLRSHERTGRPFGSKEFVKSLERRLHRPLLPRKPGPKPGGR